MILHNGIILCYYMDYLALFQNDINIYQTYNVHLACIYLLSRGGVNLHMTYQPFRESSENGQYHLKNKYYDTL